MIRYLGIRILLIVPTLLVVSLVAFYLRTLTPGDPAEALAGFDTEESFLSNDSYKKVAYAIKAEQLDLDKPLFYFSLHRASLPVAYFYEPLPMKKEWISDLSMEYGDGDAVVELIEFLENLAGDDLQGVLIKPILYKSNIDEIYTVLESIDQLSLESSQKAIIDEFLSRASTIVPGRFITTNWIPKFSFFGLENQYHLWIMQLLSGDMGVSLRDGRNVSDHLKKAAYWTLLMNGIALVLIFLVGMGLGVALSIYKGRRWKKIGTNLLYIFYAIPLFWLATLAILFLTTDQYATWLNLFPSVGSYSLPMDAGFFAKLKFSLTILLLPILCIVLSNLAYVTFQMRNSMEDQYSKKYFLAAKSKGLSSGKLIWKHAFPHAFYSMIHVIGGAIPALISGSVVIEVIFNISGMGRLLWNSLFSQDWTVVFVLVLLGAVFTIIGQFFADVMYMSVDPRVRFESKNSRR